MTAYQYTLIKYVHNDASGECVNVGLALLASDERVLRVRFNQRYGRISQFFQGAFDGDHYRNMVRALTDQFDRLAEGLKAQADFLGPFKDAPDDLARIMETALPRDATAFRWGPIYGGVTADVEGRFRRLFAEFVTRHDRPMPRPPGPARTGADRPGGPKPTLDPDPPPSALTGSARIGSGRSSRGATGDPAPGPLPVLEE